MRTLCTFLLSVSFIQFAHSQGPDDVVPDSLGINTASFKRNTVFLEALGTGMYYYSINYDRIVFKKDRFALAARVSFTYVPTPDYFEPGIPLEFSVLFWSAGERESLRSVRAL